MYHNSFDIPLPANELAVQQVGHASAQRAPAGLSAESRASRTTGTSRPLNAIVPTSLGARPPAGVAGTASSLQVSPSATQDARRIPSASAPLTSARFGCPKAGRSIVPPPAVPGSASVSVRG